MAISLGDMTQTHRSSSKAALPRLWSGSNLGSFPSGIRPVMPRHIESTAQQRSQDVHLANGLQGRLVYRPGTAMCAVLVDIEGGSHDEPAEYPGLAHFLEHLVFLGSRDFAPEQSLIPFVQRLGGRVNASTQARQTRFFCEVPATHLDQALARLMDMLANPLLATEAVWRERDVLQAEYSARTQDRQTLCEAALAWALAPGHPLADFHAGHAASLDLQSPAFLPTLRQFHREHYLPGHMRLTLVAPQSLEQQLELARRHGESLLAGKHLPVPGAPSLLPLREKRLRLGLPGGSENLLLAFALEQQGAALEAAVAFLDSLIQDEAPGGLQARLGFLELSDGVKVRLSYAHRGQGLLLMDFDRVPGADCARLESEVLGWLAFLRAAAPWPGVWEERLEILQRRIDRLEPLEVAMAPGLPEQADVRSLLDEMREERLIRLETSTSIGTPNVESAGFPLHLERLDVCSGAHSINRWQLPPANPYLSPTAPASAADPLLTLLPELPDAPGQGALFLHWSPGGGGLPHGLAHGLQRALRPLLSAAALAEVEGELQVVRGGLTLALQGEARALRQVAGDALPILQAPPLWALAQGPRLQLSELRRQAGELPIRQLLQRLPGVLDDASTEAPGVLDPESLARFWWRSRWQGLGLGDVAVDADLPGLPAFPRRAAGGGRRTWHRLDVEGEAALLLFYPLESLSAESEAAGRLLARILEPAFHQRLRGELQLGYALACGFRQFDGYRGVLFAVQSPCETVAGLYQHIQEFLLRQHERLSRLDQAQLHELVLALDQQLDRQGVHFATHAHQCWLDYRAGLPADHSQQVRRSLAGLQTARLLQQQEHLIKGLRCQALANSEVPASSWY
ncbi:pyrroloquinoline quinone biosynthesis protein PqqF [Pseudomonas sp. BN606]|nr:pyrroloquinoline quinone biosynthesis protein PqqF [Pseudomonas sp. BN606]